ncbi:MAG: Glutamine-hydrolyzing asparagine synthase, asparagine synthase (glutamine-hydrolysing) [Candidatus Peregrinibacteria bacterium GW2011_GWC2_33_13]|nr:MAG: Glutamine-hydrolyzing asparagine synthase, asparagine synthase (glutamine-hydrolysing) [Candidatus Peregrinibacteria bacterium GW2011_GWC2_33_13]
MCGISGIFKYTQITEEEISKLHLINSQMRYRGPDDSDVWNTNKVALAQVRLSIIGLENGHQPIFNETKSIALICNGEIYNYKELKDELIKKGHVFYTETDSEVILHLYEEKDVDCLNDLRGMFAFAIYDINKEQLFIARDKVGKKPLYYSEIPCGLVFSSELKAIKNNFLSNPELDEKIIKNTMRYSYSVEISNTYIKQIKRIEPGEYVIINNNGFKKSKYWKKLNSYNFDGSYQEAKNKTLEILTESVQLRLRSDVPIAILLSGGIDSSAIACLARETNDNIHAITVGYEGVHDCDEREIAKQLCKEKNITWHNLELNQKDYKNYFDEYVSYLDEPVCDVAAIAQWGIYKKAKEEGFTVLLCGNGGDEIFYGYPAHNQTAENIQFIEDAKNFLWQRRKLSKWVKYFWRNKTKLKSFIETYNPYYFDNLFIKDMREFSYNWSDNNDLSGFCFEKFLNSEKYAIDAVYSYLFNIWLINNCYFLSDKLGMAHSLELRAPFADSKLIDFVSSLPMNYRYKEGHPKYFLKEILNEVVPDYILWGNKKGFTPPYEIINELIKNYNNKYFDVKLNSYNQILIDKFLSLNLK